MVRKMASDATADIVASDLNSISTEQGLTNTATEKKQQLIIVWTEIELISFTTISKG